MTDECENSSNGGGGVMALMTVRWRGMRDIKLGGWFRYIIPKTGNTKV